MRKLFIIPLTIVVIALSSCGPGDDLEPVETIIRGSVIDEKTKRAIPDATVTTDPITEIHKTDAFGVFEFTLEELETDGYTVKVSASSYAPKDQLVKVKEGSTVSANFQLTPQSLLVTPIPLTFASNEAVKHLTIEKRGNVNLIWQTSPVTEPWLQVGPPIDGPVGAIPVLVPISVSRNGLPDDAYNAEIVITSNGGTARIPVTMIVGGGASPPPPLQIRLLDARTGDAIPDAKVSIKNGTSGHTDAEGNVKLLRAADGTVEVEAAKEGYLPKTLKLDSPKPEEELKLKPLPRRVRNVQEGAKPLLDPEYMAVDAKTGRVYVTNGRANKVSVIWNDRVQEWLPPLHVLDGPKKSKGLAVNPVRNEVYATSHERNGEVWVFDTTNINKFDTIAVGSFPASLTTNANGTRLYVTRVPADDPSLVVVDLNAREVLREIPIDGEPWGIARKGNFLYVSNRPRSVVEVIDIENDQNPPKPIFVGAKPMAIAASPKRPFVYVVNESDGTVTVINTDTQSREGNPIQVGNQPKGIAVESSYDDGDVVYVANHFGSRLYAIDMATRTVGWITVEQFPVGVAVLDGGDKIYVANDDDISILGY